MAREIPASAEVVARRRWLVVAAVAVLGLSAAAFVTLASDDEAEREHMAFLRGDEDGSSDAQRRAHIDRAIALAPERARYLESRALFRVDHHDLPGALDDLDRAITRADRPYLRYLRALVRCQGGSFTHALRDFDAAIRAQPGNTQFYRGRALARIEVGRASDALLDADQMVRDAPQWGESYFVRGAAAAALGRDLDAIVDFDEALRRRPDLVYARLARAQSRERTGDAEGARQDREEAARLTPRSYPASLDPFRY